MRRERPAAVEAIFALILAGTVARTAGLWASTRWATVVVAVYAIVLDFTPLHAELQAPARWVWIAMLVLWLANLVISRRAA